jgi:PAS domain S-box-containing protein
MDEASILRQRIEALETENALLQKQQIEINLAKELYLKIFEDFPALIWRAGLDKMCNHFNRTWLDFTGRTLEQEVGNGWAEGVHPDDFDFCLKTYVQAFDRREAFYMEYRLMDKHGEYRWLRDFGRPFFDLDNTFLGYIGSCYDITESKNNENKLVELNATKNRFMSILAHDMRSPVSTLLGFTDLLLENINAYDNTKIEKILGSMSQLSSLSLAYLDDMLLWGKIISDGILIKKEWIPVGSICQEILAEIAETANLKNISLDIQYTDVEEVLADRNMLKIIVRNLVSNAIKFTHVNGKVELSIKRTNDSVCLSVADTGIGLSEDQLAILWDFSNIQTTPGTNNEKGTGFGLSICKQLMDKHGGCIRVESRLEKGSTFSLCFPNS